MQLIPPLRLLAQVKDVRPIILDSVYDNKFNNDICLQLCGQELMMRQK
jgi:hypothetical protein